MKKLLSLLLIFALVAGLVGCFGGSVSELEDQIDDYKKEIKELKKAGYPIVSEFVPVKNRFGETCYVKKYRVEEQQ